jgi:hypothetical protein
MKALDAYRDVLKELDKYESPTFSVRDFNYFYPKSVSKYIDVNYRQLDVVMKDTQDISSMIINSHPLTISASGQVALPEDFRHLLALKIKVRFKVNMGKYKTTQSYEFWPERMKSGEKGFRYRSVFGRPNYRRYYYEISESGLQVLFDSNVVEFVISSANAWLDYVIQPDEVYLNPASNADFNDLAQNTELSFNPGTTRNYVYFEIINICRAMFLENIESPRTGMAVQESAVQQ